MMNAWQNIYVFCAHSLWHKRKEENQHFLRRTYSIYVRVRTYVRTHVQTFLFKCLISSIFVLKLAPAMRDIRVVTVSMLFLKFASGGSGFDGRNDGIPQYLHLSADQALTIQLRRNLNFELPIQVSYCQEKKAVLLQQ